MSELFEVILENIPSERVFGLLEEMIRLSQGVIQHQCTEEGVFFPKEQLPKQAVTTFLEMKTNGMFMMFLKGMKDGEPYTFDTLVRLSNHHQQYSIDFNIEVPTLVENTRFALLSELHEFSKALAATFGIQHFYGGMEPADDEDTRFFTEQTLHPIPSDTPQN